METESAVHDVAGSKGIDRFVSDYGNFNDSAGRIQQGAFMAPRYRNIFFTLAFEVFDYFYRGHGLVFRLTFMRSDDDVGKINQRWHIGLPVPDIDNHTHVIVPGGSPDHGDDHGAAAQGAQKAPGRR